MYIEQLQKVLRRGLTVTLWKQYRVRRGQIYLTKTKSELYALSTSASKWQDWRMTDCTSDLYAKGFLPQIQGMSPSFNMLAHVVLRIAASLPPVAVKAKPVVRAFRFLVPSLKNEPSHVFRNPLL